MHCQETEYKTGAMALEEELGLLMGASSHLRAGGGAASLHSLRPSPGYLAMQGALPLPPPNSPAQPNQHGSQVRTRLPVRLSSMRRSLVLYHCCCWRWLSDLCCTDVNIDRSS